MEPDIFQPLIYRFDMSTILPAVLRYAFLLSLFVRQFWDANSYKILKPCLVCKIHERI